MKSNFFIAIFLLLNLWCNAQENSEPKTIEDIFFEEQKEFGAPIWNYLNNEFVVLHALNQRGFTKKIDSLRNIYIQHLNSYREKLDSEIYNDEKVGIKYAFDRYLLNYPVYHKEITGESILPSKNSDSTIKNNRGQFNNPKLLVNKDFISYVNDYISIQANKRIVTGEYKIMDNQQLNANWGVINSVFTNTDVQCFWKQKILYEHIDNMGIKNIDKFYDSFIASCKNAEYISSIQQIYDLHKKGRSSHLIETYKKIDGFELEMHIFLPDTIAFTEKHPAIVYFHGGSWSEGKPDWFFETAKTYAKRGWVATAVEYRLKGRQGTYPFEAVKDAKSAIRWLRTNAGKFNININEVVVTGNSAGGHLALATAMVENWNEKTDDLSVSPVPNIVIVNSAVYDLTVENSKWIAEKMPDKDVVNQISPNSLIAKSPAKFLLIHGENDKRCDYSTAKYFCDKMKLLDNDVELHKIKEANHFIWFGKNYPEVAQITMDYLEELNLW